MGRGNFEVETGAQILQIAEHFELNTVLWELESTLI